MTATPGIDEFRKFADAQADINIWVMNLPLGDPTECGLDGPASPELLERIRREKLRAAVLAASCCPNPAPKPCPAPVQAAK